MQIYQNRKRGESLVEVVVSLGIIAFVFSGMATLLVLSINLNLSARERNNAINTAYNALSNYYTDGLTTSSVDSGSCPVSGGVVTRDEFVDPNGCRTRNDAGLRAVGSCNYIRFRPLVEKEVPSGSPINGTSILLLDKSQYEVTESHARYFTRGLGAQEFVISKLIRKK